MKKLIILFSILGLSASLAAAQPAPERYAAFHLSFVPPLSTNGAAAAQYTNNASLNLLVGISKNERMFSLSGLGAIILNDAHGFHMSGLATYVGYDASGIMIAGLANVVGNDFKGFQLGGLANISNNLHGLQFAGLGNIAGDVRGFQFGGLFNVAKRVSGVQFAGLVNIAQSSDCPIALLNIIKEGEYAVGLGYNEMGNIMATLRSGGRITYGILGVGYNHNSKDKGIVTEGGFGAHINITKWLRINNELKAGSIGNFSDQNTFYGNYALLPAFRPVRQFEIFGGPSINYMQSEDADNINLFPSHSLWKKHTSSRLQQVYVGWQVGVNFIF